MRQSIVQLAFFLSPIVFLVSISVYALSVTHEFYSVEDVVELHQSGSTYIIGKQYIPFERSFKEEIYRIETPRYSALGSSHMLVLRDSFFDPSDEFYNYTSVEDPISIYSWLRTEVEEGNTLPELIVIGFEPYHFIQKDIVPGVAGQIERVAQDGIGSIKPLQVLADVIADLISKTLSLRDLEPVEEYDTTIGARAFGSRHVGILRDGSYVFSGYSFSDPNSDEYRFAQTMYSARNGIGLFRTGTELNTETLTAVDGILDIAAKNNIIIVGFTTPFSPVTYEYMMDTGAYGYIEVLENTLSEKFNKLSMPFAGYTNPETLDISNNDFHDGAHYDSSVAAKILYELTLTYNTLNSYFDTENLKNISTFKSQMK